VRDAVDAARVRAFVAALGRGASGAGRIYLNGGASAVLLGWRRTTADVDIEAVPQSDGVLRAIPAIKESLNMNIELASPSHFIPPLPGWEDRSPFLERVGQWEFFHYDFYSQALAKVERGLEKDRLDVRAMLERSLVSRGEAWSLFRKIEDQLYRYPALDPKSFRAAVELAFGPDPKGPVSAP
jgi:hypothetical protein